MFRSNWEWNIFEYFFVCLFNCEVFFVLFFVDEEWNSVILIFM